MRYETISPLAMEHEMALIEKAKRDPRCFDVLYKKYHEQIFRFIYKRLDNLSQVDDLTAQVFFSALTKLHRFSNKGVPFSAWLYKIALNEINMYFRKKNSIRVIDLDAVNTPLLLEDLSNEFSDADIENLLLAMLNIEKSDAEILGLRYFEQLSFREIADIYSITENNAKVKVYRAIDRLKKLYVKTC